MLPLQHQPERICILRLSALGDATPRGSGGPGNPGPTAGYADQLDHRQAGAHAYSAAWMAWSSSCSTNAAAGTRSRELRQELRDRRFDVLFHMQVAARANLLSRLIRAPVRIGWDRARSRDFHHRFSRQKVAEVPFQHQVQGFPGISQSARHRCGDPALGPAHQPAGA